METGRRLRLEERSVGRGQTSAECRGGGTGRQRVKGFREVGWMMGKKRQTGCLETEGWNNCEKWLEGLDTLPTRQPALCRPRCTCCFSEVRHTERGGWGWGVGLRRGVSFAPCDSGEGELKLSRDFARELGRELCYESAMAKKGNWATSTRDLRGKIRQVVKQHSSVWPPVPLKLNIRWPRLWEGAA